MRDKATMLRETDEALADLRVLFDCLTEHEVRRVWLDVFALRDSLNHIRQHPVDNRDSQESQTTESSCIARAFWAPGSFWGLRYPSLLSTSWWSPPKPQAPPKSAGARP